MNRLAWQACWLAGLWSFPVSALAAGTRTMPAGRLRTCKVPGLVENCWLYSPCQVKGDFDGDHKPDLAVLVSRGERGAKGIAFLFANGRCVVAGARKKGSVEDQDMDWVANWSLDSDCESDAKGNCLLLLKAEDTGRRLYWNGKQPQLVIASYN